MKATTLFRLGQLEAAQPPDGDGVLFVESVHALTDEQLDAVASGNLVVYVAGPIPQYIADEDGDSARPRGG